MKFSVEQTTTGAHGVFRFCLIKRPSKSCYIGFLALGFSGDFCPKNHVCPLSYVRYVSVNDLYVCVGCSCVYFDIFLNISVK